MGGAPVIHIGGWPGSGKFTIGKRVATKLEGRLIDNHLMLDAARALYARGTPGSAQLREDLRAVILTHARNLPPHIPLVLTDALADEAAAIPLFHPTQQLAKDRKAALIPIVLDLSETENERRLTDPARQGRAKLKDPAVLRDIRQNDRLYFPENAVRLDVTHLSPAEAADQICAQVHP